MALCALIVADNGLRAAGINDASEAINRCFESHNGDFVASLITRRMQDFFETNFAAMPIIPKPPSVLKALDEALPLAHFLVSFARRQRGKFREKQQGIVVQAIQERLSQWDISPADVLWWITEGLPKAQQLYESIGVLAARLDSQDITIARRAAMNITGPSRSPTGQMCADLIEKLFPE